MRKTKIICTIGPASSSEEVLKKMVEAGMNVARLNFSHGDHAEHLEKIQTIKKVRDELHQPIAIMLDTKGPEYRTGTFRNHSVTVREGDTFTFTADECEGDERHCSVSYKPFAKGLQKGDRILVANGQLVFAVDHIEGDSAVCTVLFGGVMGDHKSMNFPGVVLQKDFLSEQDKSDLLFGIENDIDFVAASFVSNGEDARQMRSFLDEHGGGDIDIIAKIENASVVGHIEDICKVVDGIMVARGDLGVEIPYNEVPVIQKKIVDQCRLIGKRVVVATEMLESMIEHVRPTRAEVSDVANAVYDGASAIMLSGETAAGKFPVEAVKTMSEIAEYTEEHLNFVDRFLHRPYQTHTDLDAVSHAACMLAFDLKASCIAVNSVSGLTARMVSRFRPPMQIIGITTTPRAYRKLALSWGVLPLLCHSYDSIDVVFFHAMQEAGRILHLKDGDKVVLTGGRIGAGQGRSNMIKVDSYHPDQLSR